VIEQSIRLLAVGLSAGENRGGLLCPFCDGGSNHDKAFSIRLDDDGSILYKCHRASCDAHGIVRGGGYVPSRADGSTRKPPVVVPGPVVELTDLEYRRIYELYEIEGDTIDEVGIKAFESPDLGSRVVIPVEGPRGPDLRGYLRGYDYRSLPPCARRDKSRHYRVHDGLWAGCFGSAEHGVVVVEDTWSAIKVAQELPGLMGYALMGTHMSVEHVLEINRLTRSWYLCLDRDATLKAIKYKQQYQHLGKFSVCPLERDLKYLDAKEISEVLNQ
jgi:hypothetical protein